MVEVVYNNSDEFSVNFLILKNSNIAFIMILSKRKHPDQSKFPYYAKKVKNPGSKPAKWDEAFVDRIAFMVGKGLTGRDIAAILNVDHNTYQYWLRSKPAVRAAVDKGNKEYVENAKKAFTQIALGFEHEDTVVLTNRVTIYDEETGKPIKSYNEPLLVPVMKYYPPNAFACHKILTIKDRENWAEVTSGNAATEVNNMQLNIINNIQLSDFSIEELLTLEKVGLKQILESNK